MMYALRVTPKCRCLLYRSLRQDTVHRAALSLANVHPMIVMTTRIVTGTTLLCMAREPESCQ